MQNKDLCATLQTLLTEVCNVGKGDKLPLNVETHDASIYNSICEITILLETEAYMFLALR